MNSAGRRFALAIGACSGWLGSTRSGLAAGSNASGWRSRFWPGLMAAALAWSPLARADEWTDYPQRPIKLLLGYPAGGGGDLLGRLFASRLGKELGQSVVVVNKPGVSGALAAAELARTPADGYTLYLADTGILLVSLLHEGSWTDPLQLTPVSPVASLAFAWLAHASFPASNLRELILELKARPGQYSYASPGVGTIAHLGAELFGQSLGLELFHIPYKGGGPILADLASGQIQLAILSLPAAIAASKTQRARLLAVTSPKRVPALPDVPAITEVVPRFQAVTQVFLLAPPGLPSAPVDKLNAAVTRVLESPSLQAEFAAQSAGVQTGSPAELSALLRRESRRWRALAQSLESRID